MINYLLYFIKIIAGISWKIACRNFVFCWNRVRMNTRIVPAAERTTPAPHNVAPPQKEPRIGASPFAGDDSHGRRWADIWEFDDPYLILPGVYT